MEPSASCVNEDKNERVKSSAVCPVSCLSAVEKGMARTLTCFVRGGEVYACCTLCLAFGH